MLLSRAMDRARRYCTTPRCPNFSTRGPCASCRLKIERTRGSRSARGYDEAWLRFTRGWLALHRWCGERSDFRLHAEHSRCVQQGRRTRATITDHIRALASGGTHCDPENSQSLCLACHNRKAIRFEGGFVAVR